jgi:hypothetical protein
MVDDGNIVMKVTKVDKDGITVVAVNRYPPCCLSLSPELVFPSSE